MLIETPPNAAQVQLALQPGGSLFPGFYTYIFSSVDTTGAEGVASTTTSVVELPFTTTDGSIMLVIFRQMREMFTEVQTEDRTLTY